VTVGSHVWMGVGVQRRRVGEVIGVLCAVGRVQVDHHVRIVVLVGQRQGARLGRLQLHMVAVQVESLRVGAFPRALVRAKLIRSVHWADPLVAIRVVDRGNEQRHGRRPLGMVAHDETAEQHQQRFLATDLAAVDGALEPDAEAW